MKASSRNISVFLLFSMASERARWCVPGWERREEWVSYHIYRWLMLSKGNERFTVITTLRSFIFPLRGQPSNFAIWKITKKQVPHRRPSPWSRGLFLSHCNMVSAEKCFPGSGVLPFFQLMLVSHALSGWGPYSLPHSCYAVSLFEHPNTHAWQMTLKYLHGYPQSVGLVDGHLWPQRPMCPQSVT